MRQTALALFVMTFGMAEQSFAQDVEVMRSSPRPLPRAMALPPAEAAEGRVQNSGFAGWIADFRSRALAQGISLAPGPIFSANRQYRNCARLNYGHPWDDPSEQAMATLGRLIAAF